MGLTSLKRVISLFCQIIVIKEVPHIADHTAHHGAGGRDSHTGSGGLDLIAPTRLSLHNMSLSSHLSDCAPSLSTPLEEGGLMLV